MRKRPASKGRGRGRGRGRGGRGGKASSSSKPPRKSSRSNKRKQEDEDEMEDQQEQQEEQEDENEDPNLEDTEEEEPKPRKVRANTEKPVSKTSTVKAIQKPKVEKVKKTVTKQKAEEKKGSTASSSKKPASVPTAPAAKGKPKKTKGQGKKQDPDSPPETVQKILDFMSKVDFALEMDAFKPHIRELLPKLDFGFALNVYWTKFSCGLRRLRPGGGGYSNLTSMSFNHVPAPTPNHRLVVAMACIIELVTCRINLIRRVKVNELRCE